MRVIEEWGTAAVSSWFFANSPTVQSTHPIALYNAFVVISVPLNEQFCYTVFSGRFDHIFVLLSSQALTPRTSFVVEPNS